MQRATLRTCLLVVATLVLAGSSIAHAQCTLPYTLANGQPPDATKVMANFNALVGCVAPGGSSNAVQSNGGSGAFAGVGPLSNGQVLIGSTGNPAQAQTLTAGAGITITNGPANITVAATPGTSTAGVYRQVMSAVPTLMSTGLINWVNQASATISQGTSGVSISAPASGPDTLNAAYAAAPAPPYKLTVLFAATRSSTLGEGGIGWYDGSAKFHILTIPPSTAPQVAKWSAFNVRVGTDFVATNMFFTQPMWLQLQDDGTNVSFSISQDGANYLTVFTSAKSSAYLGASGYNNLVLFTNPRSNSQSVSTAMSWTVN